jgi:glutaredoxin
MLDLQELQRLAATDNLILYKPYCPYCKATEELFEVLVQKGLIKGYTIKYLGEDFDNQTLLELVTEHGWQPSFEGQFPSKPQIFINEAGETEYFGGNDKFYDSRWNLGDGESGEIEIDGVKYPTPRLDNPRG